MSKKVSTPIRAHQEMICSITSLSAAGVLLGESDDHLQTLISSLLLTEITENAIRSYIAKVYIEEVRQFDRVTLLDNTFWGRSSLSREKGGRYIPKNKRDASMDSTSGAVMIHQNGQKDGAPPNSHCE
jgi:hypothetical protein